MANEIEIVPIRFIKDFKHINEQEIKNFVNRLEKYLNLKLLNTSSPEKYFTLCEYGNKYFSCIVGRRYIEGGSCITRITFTIKDKMKSLRSLYKTADFIYEKKVWHENNIILEGLKANEIDDFQRKYNSFDQAIKYSETLISSKFKKIDDTSRIIWDIVSEFKEDLSDYPNTEKLLPIPNGYSFKIENDFDKYQCSLTEKAKILLNLIIYKRKGGAEIAIDQIIKKYKSSEQNTITSCDILDLYPLEFYSEESCQAIYDEIISPNLVASP